MLASHPSPVQPQPDLDFCFMGVRETAQALPGYRLRCRAEAEPGQALPHAPGWFPNQSHQG